MVLASFVPMGMIRGLPVLRAVLCSVNVIVRFDHIADLVAAEFPGRAPDCVTSGKMFDIWKLFWNSWDFVSRSRQIRIVERGARKG
jgi:hypothetical protein